MFIATNEVKCAHNANRYILFVDILPRPKGGASACNNALHASTIDFLIETLRASLLKLDDDMLLSKSIFRVFLE